jgi:hypothetical protein
VSIPALVSSGTLDLLPHGRHRVDIADVEGRFVLDPQFASSTTRVGIWEEFVDSLELLRSAVRVHAAWLSGSFLTSKTDPEDIDALFFVSARDYARADVAERQVVDAFVDSVPGPLGRPLRRHGFARVDSFIHHWRPWDDPDPRGPEGRLDYCAYRGYWDDFWQRTRKGAKTDAPTWRDGIPARGYLEVEFDAFDR